MTNLQFLSGSSASELKSAAEKLISGNLVVFPTETVYGLGADASNAEAVERIYSVKARPKNHPLIVHISSINRLSNWAKDIPKYATDLGHQFWPGPLTLVLNRSALAMDFITGGQDSVAIRVPSNPVAVTLLQLFEAKGGMGIVAPSANRFGHVSATTAVAALEELGEYLTSKDSILDGGNCEIGIESTIIDCRSSAPRIVRLGAITQEMIVQVTKKVDSSNLKSKIRVSGALEKHYAPKARIILDEEPIAGQGLIALSVFPTPEGVFRISSPKTPVEYAHVLYESLRAADILQISEVVVYLPIGEGISAAIRDRLGKASNGR